ncbi:MAG: ASCH domain-containing protein [Gammaproteobacteria bacterium]|nr:ASCH domain-containing protein [Gammaproteobacteria bacterium]NIR82248.1 ASCH domain-containing protein [Gammaproteobacteria bacterium]NIR91179.1 ASCH domain-containing protein [Gammaproteobacteria bacterium]NIU03397.1 ASCH domain-containing protein [Gammaproteobacteria bacterium]NIX84672.1 ASCH domain-containing protein [Gammaproteobacteria bacterium]
MAESEPIQDAEEVRRRLRASGFHVGGALPPLSWFGDAPGMARELGELVREGRKTATAGLLWKWRHDGREPPRPRDRQVVIDWAGHPLAVIEMTEVRLAPFEEVDAAFARDEGEGGGSLDHWRRVHWDFFARECRRIEREPDRRMPVICMRFRLLHAVAE